MPRPRELRSSKLRDRSDANDTNNRIGCWSRDKLIAMDQSFRAAMERAMMATRPAATLPPRKRRQTRR